MTGLQREEQHAPLVEDRRVRAARLWIGHRILRDDASGRIEPADSVHAHRRVPDVAVGVVNQTVWS